MQTPLYIRRFGLLLGPAITCFLILTPPPEGMEPIAWKVIAVASWMAIWWMSEALPVAVTALLPILLFPLMGVASLKSTTSPYASPAIFLFLGGFMIASAMQKWNLHKRIALTLLNYFSNQADHIILGFMVATCLLSMWISNTATTVMMMPIGLSVIALLNDHVSHNDLGAKRFSRTLMLGIAYAASVGGTATLIGTPPNTILFGFFNEVYHTDIAFVTWLSLGIPFALTMLILVWFTLTKWLFPNRLGMIEASDDVIKKELKELGPMQKGEAWVLAVFLLAATLWITRPYIGNHLPIHHLGDPMIAIFSTLLLFMITVDRKTNTHLLTWKDAEAHVPWGIILLFGGGLSLAKALGDSGSIAFVGEHIANQTDMSLLAITGIISGLTIFSTELMGNMALTSIMLPVTASVAESLDVMPIMLATPMVLAASCAFMMPIATPPNAIVYGTGHITMFDMIKAGIVLNIIALIVIIGFSATLIPWLFR